VSMTIAQKILAAHAARDRVDPGELVQVQVDLVLANDITAPLAIDQFRKVGAGRVFDPERVVLVPDHFTPNRDVRSAEQAKYVREFAREQKLTWYFEVGRMGIEHALLPEQGLVGPGDVVVGADSHTCTYGALGAFSTGMGSTDIAAAMILGQAWMKVPESMKFVYRGRLPRFVGGKDLILHTIGDIGVDGALYRAMEFTGEAIGELSMDGRLTMSNMAIEAGGKAGLIAPDAKTLDYVKGRAVRGYTVYESDASAEYAEVREYDVSRIRPTVSCPHLPSNTKAAAELGAVVIDQAVVGSCTNGRMEDLRQAAEVLRGRKVDPRVRLIVIPATQKIWQQAVSEGLMDVFVEAGAAVSTPTCGPCLGGHMGCLAGGERAIATTNRNFVGRMGSPKSEVYLSNPAVAAASAVTGRITDPSEILK